MDNAVVWFSSILLTFINAGSILGSMLGSLVIGSVTGSTSKDAIALVNLTSNSSGWIDHSISETVINEDLQLMT